MDFPEKIENIGKGNQNLAEAFKQIGLVKEAFERSTRIENKIKQNSSAINDLKNRIELLSTSDYVDTRLEKLQKTIDILVKNKFEEYTSHLLIEISHKISDLDVKKLLDQKVNWTTFNEMKNNYGGIKLKLDSFIEAEFYNYKLQIDNEVKKQEEKFIQHVSSAQEIFNELKGKISEVENKVEQVLAEDEEPVAQDNRDEADFEKMISEIEHKLITEKMPKASNLKSAESIEKTPSRVIHLKSVDSADCSQKNEGKVKGSVNELTSPLEGFDVSKSDFQQLDLYGLSISPSYKRPSIDVLSRKSSVLSSAAPGGLKQVGRKVTVLEKDVNDIYSEIMLFKKKFEGLEKDIKSVFEKADLLGKRCDGIEESQKKMEQTFVHRLRAKDMQNALKKDNIKIEKIPGEDLKKINKEMADKHKKIVQMDSYLKYIITELDFLKHSQNEKLKSFQESLNVLEREKRSQDREFNTIKTNISILESGISEYKYHDEISTRGNATEFSKDRENLSLRIRKKSQEIVARGAEENRVELSQNFRNRRGLSATPKMNIQNKVSFAL